jgi:hypothetical protein
MVLSTDIFDKMPFIFRGYSKHSSRRGGYASFPHTPLKARTKNYA